MKFFTLSRGDFHEYDPTILYTDKPLSTDEFLTMFNGLVQQGVLDHDDMIEALCEQYGFRKVESEIDINGDWDEDLREVNSSEISDSDKLPL